MPRAAPLVFAVSGDPRNPGWQLETASGEPLAVTVNRLVPVDGMNGGACGLMLLFVTPDVALQADADYRVRIEQMDSPSKVLTFRTTSIEQAETPDAVDLEYDRLSIADGYCDDELGCYEGVELRERLPGTTLPSLLILRGDEHGTGDATLLAGDAQGATGRLVRWTYEGADCVEVEQISVSGVTLATPSLCVPDRCARLSSETEAPTSSCSAGLTMGDPFWDAVPVGQCQTVPTVHVDSASGAVDVEGFGDDDDRVFRDTPADASEDAATSVGAGDGSGCALTRAPLTNVPACALGLGLTLLARRVGRRRTRF